MEVKLKENSSVKILNHSGNEIIEVHEDGTIDGGGTKLYKHEITIGQTEDEIRIISTYSGSYSDSQSSQMNRLIEDICVFGAYVRSSNEGAGRAYSAETNIIRYLDDANHNFMEIEFDAQQLGNGTDTVTEL